MRDPVLDREMFRSPEAMPSSDGVVSLVKEESDYERRKKQAAELLAVAKERQNPENYKTLSEQNRPGVFRPVATGQPQAPQPNTAQQMAQMQAMGFRPVGMADGGMVPTITAGPNAIYTMPDIGLRIGQTGQAGITTGSRAGELSPNREPPQARSPEGETYMKPPSTWSDEDIERMADQFFTVEKGRYKESEAKTPFGRGLQSLNPFRNEPDRESIIKDLKQQREIARRYGEEEAGAKAERAREEERGKTMRENKVPSIFTEVPPGVREEALARQQEKLRQVEENIPNPEPAFTASVPEGIASIPAAQTAGGSGDYMSRIGLRKEPAGSAPTRVSGVLEPAKEDALATRLSDIKRQREADKNSDLNMALMQAGLAMAAGQSPSALQNIAAGGISGLQAYSALQKDRRATDLEERKMAMQEQYYADRAAREENSIAQARRRNDIAMLNIYRQAQAAAAKEFADMLEADPQLKMDPKRQDLLKKQLTDKYLQGLMVDNSLGMGGAGGAPSLNPGAADILSE